MRILLIRHGETTGDLEDRYGGWYDDHLTETGHAQLQKTATQLTGQPVEVIYTSTLIRAKESAAIINEVLDASVIELDDLRERNYGVLGGLTKTEALEQMPGVVAAHQDPSTTDPEGEPQAVFIERVVAAFSDISSQDYELVVIVSHGGPIKAILRHLGLPLPDSIGDGEIIEVTI